MKIKFLTVLVLCLVTLSCTKQESEPPDGEAREVTFSISDMFRDVEPFGKGEASASAVGDTLRNYAKYLYCRIYPDNGQPYITLTQTSDSPVFGILKTKLPPGDYSVSFLASNQRLNIDQIGNGYDRFQVIRDELNYWLDLFALYNHRFSVGATDINTSVSLKRIVGAIELNVQDAIPLTVSKLAIEVPHDVILYEFATNSSITRMSRKEFVLTDSQKGQTGQRFLMHLLNTRPSSNLPVTIQAYNASNVLVAEKKLTVQQIYANRKTVLTGRLFDPVPNAEFSITIDPVWRNPIPKNISF